MEKLELVAQLFNLQAEILHLQRHGLVVFDQRRSLFLVDSDLLDKILSGRPLIMGLLRQGKSLVGVNQLTLRVDNHGLELVPLPHELLRVRIDLLLKLQVLLQQGIPLALAASLPPLMLLLSASQLAQLLRLRFKDV